MTSFILLLVNVFICVTSFPLAEIPQGIPKGQYTKTVSNKIISSFTAIAYAKPPVGRLRFELARPAGKWKGLLGFHSTGDETVPGNNSLRNQNLAISQSGTGLASWAIAPKDTAVINGKKLASSFNCSITSSAEMVECLKRVDAYEMTERQHAFYEWFMDPAIPFKPVVEPNIENAFLPEHPTEIIKSGKAAKVPLLTGITTQDGAFRSSVIFAKPNLVEELDANFSRIAPLTFLYDEIATDKDYVTRKIKEFYFNNNTITNRSKMELTDAFTDAMFLTGANNALWLHLNHTDQPVNPTPSSQHFKKWEPVQSTNLVLRIARL
ncbi:hypothetical protein ILUMI_04890, partial [Ignelater luminosus]